LIPALKKTGAELGPDEKNRISHRGQALTALAERLLAERRKGRGERGKTR
jgi:XTP/dITP diphosphohydrolase